VIFYRQAFFYLSLTTLSLVFFIHTLFFSEKSEETVFEKKEALLTPISCVQKREGVLKEVFGGVSFTLKAKKSTLRWENSLQEEMFDVEGFSESHGISFSSKQLIWDKKKNELFLKDDVSLIFKDQFTLLAKDQLVIFFDQKAIKKIETEGEVTLHLVGASEEEDGVKAHAFGQTVLNPLDSTVTVLSALNGTPIHIHQKKIHIFGDTLTYSLKTHEVYLKGKEGERVLVFDEEKEFEMSAQALRFKKTTPVQKGYIQGVGDVRFLLGSKEREFLSKIICSSKES
jgi:lipopolysaccharide export system protein LptA